MSARLAVWGIALALCTGCINFVEGLNCSLDEDCLDYVCRAGVCRAPEWSEMPDGSDEPEGPQATGPITLVEGESQTEQVILHRDRVVWRAPGVIKEVPKTGGTVRTVYQGPSGPMISDGTSIYVASEDAILGVREGAAVEVLATAATGEKWGGGIAVDSEYVYWLATGSEGKVLRVPKAGGQPLVLASDQGSPSSIAVAGGSVFWTIPNHVRWMPVSGSASFSEEAEDYDPRGLVAAGDLVLWIVYSFEYVARMPVAGGKVTMSDLVDGRLDAIAVLGSELFVAGDLSYRYGVGRTPAAGGQVTEVWGRPPGVAKRVVSVAADDSGVFWADSDGAIMGVAH